MHQSNEWLFLLGAGASIAPPTEIPAFDPLAEAIFNGLGWARADPDPTRPEERWARVGVKGFPLISTPRGRVPPEVLFGTLRLFGVPFEAHLRRLLGNLDPNLSHYVAAAVLQGGGAVWTPNVDLAVEEAFRRTFGTMPSRSANVSSRPPDDTGAVRPLSHATSASLVKFHGSLDIAGSLAFTDRQLLVPPAPEDVDVLVRSVRGRRVVVLGYAGADADLSALLIRVMRAAPEVVWFEPSAWRREQIVKAYRGVPMRFAPDVLAPAPACFSQTIQAFAEFADDNKLTALVPDEVRRVYLTSGRGHSRPFFSFSPPPSALIHARLVQRFGDPDGEDPALRAAAREELAAVPHAFRSACKSAVPYMRWRLSQSLYREGRAAAAVNRSAQMLTAHRLPASRRVRDVIVSRQCALLLLRGQWDELETFLERAMPARCDEQGRPHPADLYYLAHARRYRMDITAAVEDARLAESGLARMADPERLAGAVMESGILALYQGRFEDALDHAADLSDRRGGYAILRWRAWGLWLSATAHIYLGRTEQARDELEEATGRFRAEALDRAVMDCRIAELLADRVDAALSGTAPDPGLPEGFAQASKRQQDDVSLVLADLALNRGDLSAAGSLLSGVLDAPSCGAAARWADLGVAELHRLQGRPSGFLGLEAWAGAAGATWLQAQAATGARLAEGLRAPDYREVVGRFPQLGAQDPSVLGRLHEPVDGRRVLWLVT